MNIQPKLAITKGTIYLVILLATITGTTIELSARTLDNNELIRAGYQQICQGNNQQAVQTLSAAVQANPNSIDARRYLGFALLQSGLATQAVLQLESLKKLSPESSSDLVLMADAYFYAGQYQKALQCYQDALGKDPGLDNARTGIVHTYIALGDSPNALNTCRQGLQQAKTSSSRSQYEKLLQEVQPDPNWRSHVRVE